jgi:hypothetical protein
MWKCILFLLASITVVFTVSSCSASLALKVNLDEEFTLSPGQSVMVQVEDLKLEFKGVTEDSRCPSDVTCIWEGRVVCDTQITYSGSSSPLTLIQPGLTDQYTDEMFKGYVISFKVTPYPNSGQQITPDIYQLHIIISKLPELTSVAGSIVAEPANYAGQSITIIGYYRGWDLLHEANMTPPVTRSDWVIKDSTGAIYVSAGSDSKVPEGLNPGSIDDTDAVLDVTGIVRLAGEGQPFIQAISIERLY